jgi:hypothetical protein
MRVSTVQKELMMKGAEGDREKAGKRQASSREARGRERKRPRMAKKERRATRREQKQCKFKNHFQTFEPFAQTE